MAVNTIVLNWQALSQNEEGFNIYKSLDGVNYTYLASTDANATSYTVPSIEEGQQCWFRVTAFTYVGESTYVQYGPFRCYWDSTYLLGKISATIKAAKKVLNFMSSSKQTDIVNRKAYEKYPITVEFQDSLAENDVIASMSIDAVNGLSLSNSDTLATVTIADTITTEPVKATTIGISAQGNIFEKDVLILTQEWVDGQIDKQPSEYIIVEFDFTNKIRSGAAILAHYISITRKSDGVDITPEIWLDSEAQGAKVLVALGGGVNRELYNVRCQIVTT